MLCTQGWEVIFDILGLSAIPSVREAYNSLAALAPRLEKKRGDSLSSAQRHYITCHADFEGYRTLYRQRLVSEPEQLVAIESDGTARYAKGAPL